MLANITQRMIPFVEQGRNSPKSSSERKNTPRRVLGKKKKRKEKTVFEAARETVKEDLKPIKKVIVKSIKKKRKGAICKYCKYFFDSEKRRLERDNATLIDYRKCLKSKKEITDLTEGCEEFELNTTFWCNKWDCWLNIIMCKSRRKKAEEGCVRCSQGKIIGEISDGSI